MAFVRLIFTGLAVLPIILAILRYFFPSRFAASQSNYGTTILSVVVALAACRIAVFIIGPQTSSSDPDEFHATKMDVSKILKQNLRLAQHSWEHGVLTHALLELQNPELTVFAGPGYGIHLHNPHRVPGGFVRIMDTFPGGKLPKCGGAGSGNLWGRYDEWTRVKGLRYAAAKISTDVRPRRFGEEGGKEKMWLYREGAEAGASAADAASFGYASLLLERAGAEDPSNPVGAGRNAYGEAADEMVRWLVEDNVKFWLDGKGEDGEDLEQSGAMQPKRKIGASEGRRWAISHRTESPQLWADSVFMVPPFFAAYAVARQDEKWLWEAVEQIKAHHEVLAMKQPEKSDMYEEDNEENTLQWRDEMRVAGLWKHIVTQPEHLGDGACCHDEGLWLTGNAWVLAGIARVLSVIERWEPAFATGVRAAVNQTDRVERRQEARKTLKTIANDMLRTLRPFQPWEGKILSNYLDVHRSGDDTRHFADAAGTAFLVSATYRLGQLNALEHSLQWTDDMCRLVAEQIDAEGMLHPVTTVNEIPAESSVLGTSEGQSFALLMFAARRDCEKLGMCKRFEEPGWLSRLLGLS